VIASTLERLFLRDLATFREQLLAYPDERDLWKLAPGLRNSAGTLALHVAGNLRYFVGAQLGHTAYARDRDAEFARRDVPRAELLDEIDRAMQDVEDGFAEMSDEPLAGPYPLELPGGLRLSTGTFLMHLATHLAYHLGQVDFHRRFTTGQTGSIRALSFHELGSLD
jgi:uncharacterized damage-inducible protein DinB